MGYFDIKVRRAETGKPFKKKVKTVKSSCEATSYTFSVRALDSFIPVGESVDISVTGGIPPYTWNCLTSGSSFALASTNVLVNTLTSNFASGVGFVKYEVTDSCGNTVTQKVQEFDFDAGACISGDCATYPDIVITGPTVDAVIGDSYTATGGLPPYRWRLEGGAIDGNGTILGFSWMEPGHLDSMVTVIDMCGNRKELPIALAVDYYCDQFSNSLQVIGHPGFVEILDDTYRGIGDNGYFEARGGAPPYTWNTTGAITLDAYGHVTEITDCSFTVEIVDACGNSAYYEPGYISCPDPFDFYLIGPRPLENDIYCASKPAMFGITGSAWLEPWGSSCVKVHGAHDSCTVILYATAKAWSTQELGQMKTNSETGDGVCMAGGAPCGTDSIRNAITELELIGPDEPDVGDSYSASGGTPPHSYTFSGGSIDSETGEILEITECDGPRGNGAVADVSVTDACGQTKSIEVRLLGGRWIFTSKECSTDPCQSPSGYYQSSATCERISGGSRILEHYGLVSMASPYSYSCDNSPWPCCTYCTWTSLANCQSDSLSSDLMFKLVYHYKKSYYSWEC